LNIKPAEINECLEIGVIVRFLQNGIAAAYENMLPDFSFIH